MDWFALLLAVAALGMASDSESKVRRLARRVAELEAQRGQQPADDPAEPE